MRELTSQYVVPIREAFFSQDGKEYYIVMEKCENDLADIFQGFSQLEKKKYSRDIIKAIAFFHKNGKIHRDIKL